MLVCWNIYELINKNVSFISLKIDSSLKFPFQKAFVIFRVNICVMKKCDHYISTLGSKIYFREIKHFSNTKIKIDYFDFKDNKYSQNSKNFISRLSIIDLLFNLGPGTLEYLKNNFFICK